MAQLEKLSLKVSDRAASRYISRVAPQMRFLERTEIAAIVEICDCDQKLLAISAARQSNAALRFTLPFKNITYINNLGEFIRLITYLSIYSAFKKYTWKPGILCVINGVGLYIEQFCGT